MWLQPLILETRLLHPGQARVVRWISFPEATSALQCFLCWWSYCSHVRPVCQGTWWWTQYMFPQATQSNRGDLSSRIWPEVHFGERQYWKSGIWDRAVRSRRSS